jgi:hypothetical protein
MSIQRRKRIYGKRRRKSAFRQDTSIIDCDDRLDYLKNRKYCDNLEYQRRKNRYEGKDYKTDEEIKASNKNVTLDTTVEYKNIKPVGGAPSFLPGPKTLKALKIIDEQFDIKKEIGNAWRQWMSGGTFRGRGND